MRNVKASVAPMESSPYSSLYQDSRTRFKHQSLKQDYDELQKESEAMKTKLQKMKQKKFTLRAEVSFLRRRYKYLVQNQSPMVTPERSFSQPHNSVIGSRTVIKEKKKIGKAARIVTPPTPVPRFDLNRKGKVYNENDMVTRTPAAPDLGVYQKERIYVGGDGTSRRSVQLPDLNQTERFQKEKETNVTPVFDLNQISREEYELQANEEQTIQDYSKSNISMVSMKEELSNEIKLSSICRKIGNGSNRGGKRKITWQDQVALRV